MTHASHSGRDAVERDRGDLAGDLAQLAPPTRRGAGDRGGRGSRGRSRGPRSTPGGGTGTAPRRAGDGTAARRAAAPRCARLSALERVAVAHRRHVVDADHGHVHVAGVGLQVEECRVQSGQTFHVFVPSRRRAAPDRRPFFPDVRRRVGTVGRGGRRVVVVARQHKTPRPCHAELQVPDERGPRQRTGRTGTQLLRQGLVRAGLVANAYRPVGRQCFTMAPSFFASWLTTEAAPGLLGAVEGAHGWPSCCVVGASASRSGPPRSPGSH